MREKVKGFTFKLFGATMLALLAVVILKPWGITNAAEIIYEPVYNQTEARSMLEQINEFRKSDAAWYWNSDNETKTYCTDLQDLVYDYELEEVAMQRAAEIAINWDHTRPDGRTPWTAYDDLGYERFYSAENIAAGQTSASAVFTAWREDNDNYSGQGHRRNMLNSDMKAIGIACVTVNGIKYWVQEFAGNTPTGTETAAVDTAVMTKVQVSDSDITFVSCQNEEVSINVGESISIPELFASVKFSGAWPEGKLFSVRIPGVFDTADNEYVSISDGTVVGLKAGTGTITGMFLGQSVSLTVNVTGNSDPDPEIVYVGDVDGDKQITPKDVTVMRRALAGGWGVTVDVADGDVDGDKQITPKDVTLLRRYLAGGWGVKLPEKTNQNSVTGIAIDQNNFPDENFRNYVIDNFDTDKNNILSENEANVSSIYCPRLAISDLTGIEYFDKITSLICYENNLSSLDISNNVALTSLHCSGNSIETLDLEKNINLVDVSCGENKLTDLNIDTLSKLNSLYCSNNLLDSLDVSNNAELVSLDCFGNKLETLELNDNTKLESLRCTDNNIKLLDLRNNPELKFNMGISVDNDVYVLYADHDHQLSVDYQWSDDYAECTATVTCTDDDCHFQRIQTVISISTIKTLPTVESKGVTEYTAVFEDNLINDRVIDIENIEKLAPDFANNISIQYYYKQLSDFEKQIYTTIKESDKLSTRFVLAMKDDVDIEEISSNINRALTALFADYPKEKYYYSSSGYIVTFENNEIILNLGSSDIFESEIEKGDTIAERIVEAIPKGTDAYTTIRNLATYIESYTAYHCFGGGDGVQSHLSYLGDHTALGVFLYKESVCEGYADAGKILFDRLGIPCLVVGNAGHAWNYIMLEDGKWYAIDLSIAGLFSQYEPDLRDGFVTSNTFLVGAYGQNYYNTYPYNLSDVYLNNPSEFEFPALSNEDYVYHGNYSFNIEEVEDIEDDEEGRFLYSINDDGTTCTITYYLGKQSGDLIIPDIIDGYTVTEIGEGAFYKCKGFTGNLVIPDTVTIIGNGAFEDCYNLKGTLTLSENLIIIGDSAFVGCSRLSGSLILPDSIESIGTKAFYCCQGFTGDLIIPEKIKELHKSVFYQCYGLEGTCYIPAGLEDWDSNNTLISGIKEFVVDENNEYLTSVDGVLYDKAQTKLIACPTKWEGFLDIPDTVTEICPQACFWCREITGIKLPSELLIIGDRAFESCWNITGELVLPEKLTTIGWSAFSMSDGYEGFVGDLIIPDSVTSIGESAFSGNHFGGAIKLSENITEIKESTFQLCKFSSDLIIPDKVKIIGEFAFDSQSYLDNPTFSTGCKLILPEGIEIIGKCAFQGAGLTGDVDLSGIEIGENAFSGCFMDKWEFTGVTGLVNHVYDPAYCMHDGINDTSIAIVPLALNDTDLALQIAVAYHNTVTKQTKYEDFLTVGHWTRKYVSYSAECTDENIIALGNIDIDRMRLTVNGTGTTSITIYGDYANGEKDVLGIVTVNVQ